VPQIWWFALGVVFMGIVRAGARGAEHRQPAAIDVREEIAQARVGRYHWFLVALIALAVFFVGYDTFNAAYVIRHVIGPWQLGPGQAGLLVSSGLAGFAAAALVQGKISDEDGRRVSIILGLWMMTIFSYATGRWSDSFWSFWTWRFLTGLGLGMLLPASVAYMNEIAPRHTRTMMATWGWGLGFSAGGVAAVGAGVYLTPAYGWRVLYDVASISGLVALACHFLLPESPQYLAMRGRTAEVRSTLARLNPLRAPAYLSRRVRFAEPEPHDRPASITLLFSPRYRRTTLAVSASAFFVLFALYGLIALVPAAMVARGETFAARSWFGAFILGMSFAGTLACSFVVDRVGVGRAGLAAWWLLGGSAAGVMGVTHGHRINVVATALAAFGIAGGLGALCNVASSWYDTEVRCTAVGMMLGIGFIGVIPGPYVSRTLQQIFTGDAVVFLSISVAALLAAIGIAFASPPSSGP
jgi:MFS family permease